jgi:hypothetical protein
MSRTAAEHKSNQEGKVTMSVDLAQLKRIREVNVEIEQGSAALRALKERRTELITGLDEFAELEQAQAALRAASIKLKQAIQSNPELTALEELREDEAWRLNDLRHQLSLNLIAYREDTARDVVQDSDGRNRKIELTAKLSPSRKRVLDQTRMSFSQHFGKRIAIPEAPAVKQLQISMENK